MTKRNCNVWKSIINQKFISCNFDRILVIFPAVFRKICARNDVNYCPRVLFGYLFLTIHKLFNWVRKWKIDPKNLWRILFYIYNLVVFRPLNRYVAQMKIPSMFKLANYFVTFDNRIFLYTYISDVSTAPCGTKLIN